MTLKRAAFILMLLVSVPLKALSEPSSTAKLQREAVALYQEGRYQAAAPLYRRLAEAQPDNKGALKDWLIAVWLGEQYREAVEVGTRLTQQSDDSEVWFIFARSLLATGQKEEALTAFKRCRQLAPNEEQVQFAEVRVARAL